MMTICPKCGQHYDVDQDYVGYTVDCEICGSQFEVKQPSCVPMSADISPQAQEQNAMSEIPAQSFDAAQMHEGTASMSSPPHRSSMKPLVCEMCGSSDLMKTDGVFVCQSCGTKYSVEEAKKMMIAGTVNVAGTVKIDKSEELENLYKLARRARDTRDFPQAVKYYDLILQRGDSDSWEAYFYSDYCRSLQGDVSALDTIKKYEDRLTTVVGLVATIANIDSRQNAYDEIVLKICELLLYLKDCLKDTAINLYRGNRERVKEELQRLAALCYSLGNSLHEQYEGGDKAVQVKTFTDCWITGVEIHSEFPDEEGRQRMIRIIQRYRSNYVAPESYKNRRKAEILKKIMARIKKIAVRIMFTLIACCLIIWVIFRLFHWFLATLFTILILGCILALAVPWWFGWFDE